MRKILPGRVGSMFLAFMTAASAIPAALAIDVNVAWDASPDAAIVSNYNLYISLTPMSSGGQPPVGAISNRVGNVTSKLLSLEPLTRYYVGVSAEGDGQESLLSNVIEFTTLAASPPFPEDTNSIPDPTNTNNTPGPTEPHPSSSPPGPFPTSMNLVGLLPKLSL